MKTALYNEALQLAKEGEYLKAEQLLKKFSQEKNEFDEVNWALGLIQISLGRPHQALQYWRSIKHQDTYQVEEKWKRIESSIPYYDELYIRYHQALKFIDENGYEEAWSIFHDLIKEKDALPLEFYTGYLFTSLYLGKNEVVSQFLCEVPVHIKSSPPFVRGKLLFEAQKQMDATQLARGQSQEAEDEVAEQIGVYKRKNKTLIGSLSAAVILLFVSLFIIFTQERPGSEQQSSALVEEKGDEDEADSLAVNHEEEIQALQQQLDDKKTELETFTAQLQNAETKEDFLVRAGMSTERLVREAEHTAYQKGYTLYQNGQYEAALEELMNSIQVNQDAYFSDDAFYFAIQAKRKLGQTDVPEAYETFLSYESESFTSSPYYDDVLFEQANLLLQSGENEAAIERFERLANEYNQEWTGIEAARLLSEMAE